MGGAEIDKVTNKHTFMFKMFCLGTERRKERGRVRATEKEKKEEIERRE